LEQGETDNNKPKGTIRKSIAQIALWDFANLGQFNHTNQRITLPVIN
jgi:hypothetical protein